MKNNILKRSVQFIVSCFVVFMLFSVFSFISKADSSTRDVPVKSYEYGKEQYLLESDYLVSTMSYGKSSLGAFSVSGNINSDTYYNGYKAYINSDVNAKSTSNPGDAKKKKIVAIAVTACYPLGGIPYVVDAVKTNRKLRDEMFLFAITKFYLDELDAFVKS